MPPTATAPVPSTLEAIHETLPSETLPTEQGVIFVFDLESGAREFIGKQNARGRFYRLRDLVLEPILPHHSTGWAAEWDAAAARDWAMAYTRQHFGQAPAITPPNAA